MSILSLKFSIKIYVENFLTNRKEIFWIKHCKSFKDGIINGLIYSTFKKITINCLKLLYKNKQLKSKRKYFIC